MNLSIVLWNCKGPGKQPDRLKSMEKTYERWHSEGKMLVLLAQEVDKNVDTFWRGRKLVKFIPLNTDDEDRIKCSILTAGGEKLLICSYHGRHNKITFTGRKNDLKIMLTMVDKIKSENNCCAALVGGDYNLVSRVCAEVLSDPETPPGAKVYDDYITPPWREKLIDFIIAWPKERFLHQRCGPIPIEPHSDTGSEITDGSLFDHAPIRYDFIFTLPGKTLQSMIGQGVEEHLSASLQISLKLADDNLDYNTEIEGFPAWVIPKENLESAIITKERSDKADKIISILLCYEHFRHRLSFPKNDEDDYDDDQSPLRLKWQAVIPSCLLRGINLYDSEDCGENISIETAIEIANKYNKNENIKLIEKKIWKKYFKSQNFLECFTSIVDATDVNNAVILNTTDSKKDSKTISFVRNGVDNESVILIDSHFQNNIGPLIRKIPKAYKYNISKFLPLDMQQHEEWEFTIITRTVTSQKKIILAPKKLGRF